MIPTFRQQVARGVAASAALAWALAWGVPALWSLASGVDIHQHFTGFGEWLRAFLPLRPNTLGCLRDLAVAALPGAAWALRRPGVERWATPRAWRPEPLLLAFAGMAAVETALVAGAIHLDLWSRPYHLLVELGPALAAAGTLAVLLRRLGPVRRWDGGALAAVGTLATAAWGPMVSALSMGWLLYGPHPISTRPELPLHLLHWPLVVGLAAVACRWVATRPGRKPRGAYTLAVLAAVALPAVLLAVGGAVHLLPMLVLAIVAAGRHLWLWSERPDPGFGVPVAVRGG